MKIDFLEIEVRLNELEDPIFTETFEFCQSPRDVIRTRAAFNFQYVIVENIEPNVTLKCDNTYNCKLGDERLVSSFVH